MCKMEHFGNCDRDHNPEKEEYCIFHKPNKSEEEAREFYNKFVLRFVGYKPPWNEGWVFAGPIDARKFVFPEIPKTANPETKTGEEFTFENVVFENHATFENAVFESHASFYRATFKGVVSFENATFKGAVSFVSTEFKKFAIFRHSKFLFGVLPFWIIGLLNKSPLDSKSFPVLDEYLALPGATFNNALFKNGVTFYRAEFSGMADFREVQIQVVNSEEVPLLDLLEFHSSSTIFNEASFNYVSFRGARFSLGVGFDRTIFETVKFNECGFGETKDAETSFREATFKNEAVFGDNVEFKGQVTFEKAHFHGNVKFQGVNFEKAIFENTTFSGETKFLECTFNDHTKFSRTKFKGRETSFAKSEFKDTALFASVVFESNTTFKNTVFHKNVRFSNVIFRKTVEFPLTEFKGKTSFDGSIFERLAVFVEQENTDTNEPTPKFHGELSFANCDFRQGADFLGSLKNETNLSKLWEFFSSRFSNPQAMIEALRIQRLSFEKEGKRDEADRMFVLEMRAKRRARVQNARNEFERIKARVYNFVEWLLADLPSEYGTNWVRLFLMSLLVIIGNAVPYTIWSNFIKGLPQTSNIVIRFANALYYSLVTFTTLGYGDMHPTGWLKALSAVEALTGAVFMALIVAVIARKWMR